MFSRISSAFVLGGVLLAAAVPAHAYESWTYAAHSRWAGVSEPEYVLLSFTCHDDPAFRRTHLQLYSDAGAVAQGGANRQGNAVVTVDGRRFTIGVHFSDFSEMNADWPMLGSVAMDDPVLEALMAGDHATLHGGDNATSFSLRGSRAAISALLATCRRG